MRNRIPIATNNSGGQRLARRTKPDYSILIFSALLLVIGLVVVYSISPGLAASRHVSQSYYVIKQFIAVGLGLVTFGIAAYLPLKFWRAAITPMVLLSLAGCLVVMITPIDEVYQAHRWIRLGGFSFQIVELIKVTLLLWVAKFLTDRWRGGQLADFDATLKPLLIVLLGVGVVVAKLQSDLGSTGVIIAMIGMMVFAVGVPVKRLLIIVGLVVILAILAVSSSGYRRERLATYLHPQSNCQGNGYQACQALISVGSGGVFGLGLGYSVQAYGYLPEASNDSIFAIIAEKFGFVGTFSIILIYGTFITRLKRIVNRTSDQFSRLVVVGVLAWLSTQLVINVGAMIGLLPLKGITLPLISQGGTSLIFLTAALGLVFQISRYTSNNVTEISSSLEQGQSASNNPERRRNGRAYSPTPVTRPRG